VREDLTTPQQAVQSCHAAIEAANAFKLDHLPDHPSVIICSAKNEQKLHSIRKYLIENGIQHAHFYESDLDDQLTALATEPVHGERRQLFRKFQLLKPDKAAQPKPQEEAFRYVWQYDDGSYYSWAGDCGRSPHKTWSLAEAVRYSDSDPRGFSDWTGGKVVKVRVGYDVIGGVQ
jgi:hypothetical protein